MRRALAVLLLALALPALAPAAAPAAALPSQWRKGLDVTAFWWSDFSGDRARTWLKRARTDARAQWVTFVVSWYQYSSAAPQAGPLGATEIHPSFGSAASCRGKNGTDHRACKTPSLGALGKAIARAKALGLRVALRPQVDPGRTDKTTTQRDLIDQPADRRRAWFDSYKYMLSQYARLARDARVDSFVIGADLSGMTNDEDDRLEWRAIIAQIRSGDLMGDGRGGYRGELVYAAAWDSLLADAKDPAQHLFFWDALDVIGIDAYFPLVPAGAAGNPATADLRAGWGTTFTGYELSPVQVVRALRDEYGKAVMFTALGYLSREGTAAFPEKSDYDQKRAGGHLSETAQARAVQAAFDVWSPIAAEGWFDGISWWEWPSSGRGGHHDGSHSLQGKRAQLEICRRHAGVPAHCRISPGL